MKQLLWFLAVSGLTASVVSAVGPNAGGVLWVHDTGVVVSSDPSVWPAKPADCFAVDNEMALSPVGGGRSGVQVLEGLRGVPRGKQPATEVRRLGSPVR